MCGHRNERTAEVSLNWEGETEKVRVSPEVAAQIAAISDQPSQETLESLKISRPFGIVSEGDNQ